MKCAVQSPPVCAEHPLGTLPQELPPHRLVELLDIDLPGVSPAAAARAATAASQSARSTSTP